MFGHVRSRFLALLEHYNFVIIHHAQKETRFDSVHLSSNESIRKMNKGTNSLRALERTQRYSLSTRTFADETNMTLNLKGV